MKNKKLWPYVHLAGQVSVKPILREFTGTIPVSQIFFHYIYEPQSVKTSLNDTVDNIKLITNS